MLSGAEIFEIVVKGAFNGLGTAVGTYLAVSYAIKHGERWLVKIVRRMKNGKKKKKLT